MIWTQAVSYWKHLHNQCCFPLCHCKDNFSFFFFSNSWSFRPSEHMKSLYCLANGLFGHEGYKPQFASWLYYPHTYLVNYSSIRSCQLLSFCTLCTVIPKGTQHIADAIDLCGNYHLTIICFVLLGFFYFSYRTQS